MINRMSEISIGIKGAEGEQSQVTNEIGRSVAIVVDATHDISNSIDHVSSAARVMRQSAGEIAAAAGAFTNEANNLKT